MFDATENSELNQILPYKKEQSRQLLKMKLIFLLLQYVPANARFSTSDLCRERKIKIPREVFIQRSICQSQQILNYLKNQVS